MSRTCFKARDLVARRKWGFQSYVLELGNVISGEAEQ